MDPAKTRQLTPLETPADVKIAMEEIATLTKVDVPVITETVFCQHLLPILTNTNGDVDLSIWLDMAGSVTRPIDVSDYNGNILFRVPALSRTPSTRLNSDPRRSMNEIVSTAKLKSDQHPMIGSTYLQVQLENKFGEALPDLDTVRAWNAILLRYNLEPLNIPGTLKPDEAAAPASDKPLFGEEDEAL